MAKRLAWHRSVLVALTLLALLLAACSPPAAQPTSPPPTKPAPTAAGPTAAVPTTKPARAPAKLTLWVYMSDNDLAVLQGVTKEYEALSGDTVQVVNYPYFELLEKVDVAFPAGEGPDLCEIPHTDTGVWGQAGLIAPFPEGVLSEEERGKYAHSALDAFFYDGQQFGIPQIADVVVLLYNKALVKTPPTTMEELIQMAKDIQTKDIGGFWMLDNNMWYGWCFVSGYGGYIFGRTDKGYDVNDLGVFSRGTAQGLDYLFTLRREHKIIPENIDWNLLTGHFTEGKLGMMIQNANQASIYQAAGVDVGMAVIPKLPNGNMPAPMLSISGWAINGYSKQQQAAAELAVYLGGHLAVPLFKSSQGNIPVRLDAIADPLIAGNPNIVAAIEQVGFSQPVPNVPEMGLVWVPVNSAFELAAKGDKTSAQALSEASEVVKAAIAGQ
ncbi:MAG TPA: extracellular solute-binding protein [Anaerolineae bacterium]|nr:extracellular solute-binding protein [Anaerolineae bacterium]